MAKHELGPIAYRKAGLICSETLSWREARYLALWSPNCAAAIERSARRSLRRLREDARPVIGPRMRRIERFLDVHA